MINANKDVPKLNICSVDANQSKSLGNVFLELWKENMQTPEEGLTNDKGVF